MPRGAGRDGGGEGWCRGGENNTARILTLLLAPPRDQLGLRAHFLSRSHHGEGKQRRQQQQQQQQQIRVASPWVVGAVPGTDDAGVLPTPIRSFPLSNSPPPLLLEAADGSFVIRRNVFIECMGMEVGLNTFNPK